MLPYGVVVQYKQIVHFYNTLHQDRRLDRVLLRRRPASLTHSHTSLPPTVTNVSTTKLSKDRDGCRKNQNQTTAPVALSFLRALEPPRPESKMTLNRPQSEERYTVSGVGIHIEIETEILGQEGEM
jgi:hypothetical protein